MAKKLTINVPVGAPRDPAVAALVRRRGKGAHKGLKDTPRSTRKHQIRKQIEKDSGV